MQQQPHNQLFWFSLYTSWILVLAWLSITSTPAPIQLGFDFQDKLNHALAYALLAFLGVRALATLPMVDRAWLWSLVAALIFGAAMEAAQATLTEVRVAEWGDWVADAFGAAAALALNGLWKKKRRQAS